MNPSLYPGLGFFLSAPTASNMQLLPSKVLGFTLEIGSVPEDPPQKTVSILFPIRLLARSV